MTKGRLEAFSDGVIAIIITIMVLELKVPHGVELEDLRALWPVLSCYVLSFIFLGIYWVNHHHLFQAVRNVRGAVLWANLHLLFWLSLVPFSTSWMGENHFATLPVAFYGANLLACGYAYFILTLALLRVHDRDSTLAKAIGSDRKGKLSLLLYSLAVPLAFFAPSIAIGFYILVAVIWLVPDSRIEKVLSES